jgi:AcrR family transcriptional regulator
LALFDDHGVRALTQPKIARAAGLRTSNLTYYFPLKADLLAAILDASHRRRGEDAPEDLDVLVRDRQRLRLLLAVILEVSDNPEARRVVADHLDRFSDVLADHFDVAPDEQAIARLADEIRGAGLRLLLDPEAKLSDLATRARRLGLEPRIGFEDPDSYDAEIRHLVPGYDTLHRLLPGASSALLASSGTMLVVGCGTGAELERLADALPGWRFDAVDG